MHEAKPSVYSENHLPPREEPTVLHVHGELHVPHLHVFPSSVVLSPSLPLRGPQSPPGQPPLGAKSKRCLPSLV